MMVKIEDHMLDVKWICQTCGKEQVIFQNQCAYCYMKQLKAWEEESKNINIIIGGRQIG